MIVKPFYRGKTAQLSLVIQSSCTEFLLVGYKNLAWSKGTLSVNFLQAQVLTGPTQSHFSCAKVAFSRGYRVMGVQFYGIMFHVIERP